MVTRKKAVVRNILVLYRNHPEWDPEVQGVFATVAEAEAYVSEECCGPDEAEAYFLGQITHKVSVNKVVTTKLEEVK